WIGNNYFDHDFLEVASRLYPDWHFHVLGPITPSVTRPNVRWHGELPFAETIPFLKHAKVGLLNFSYTPGAESFTDSLKMIQYTYCGLPVVAPEFLNSQRRHVFHYKPADEASIRAACDAAISYNRSAVDRAQTLTWTDLSYRLWGERSRPKRV